MNYQGKIKLSYFQNAATGQDPIESASYTEILTAANNANGGIQRISGYNGTDQNVILAIGASGSESDLFISGQGGMFNEDVLIDEGIRLSIKSKLADSTSGELVLNLWG